jgi:hypothetical protein
MSTHKILLIAFWSAFGIIAGYWVVRIFWRLRSALQRRAAGEPEIDATRSVIWRDPGPAERLDLAAGPGGKGGEPAPPFVFLEEHTSGSQPTMSVRDARGRVWRVKWGSEVNTEAFCTRLAWAAGYFVETTYFVPEGRIEGARELQRARACIDENRRFENARFELDEQGVVKHFDAHSWAWNDNPFVGTRELKGLKILMMLLSNWDNKDVRDVSRGSNTAIFEYRTAKGREARYLIIDWGAALGAWGGNVLNRGRWNAAAFAAQNDQLITGVNGDAVSWGYAGQRTADAVEHITTADVRWLHQYLGPISHEQIAAALRASGGTDQEVAGFTDAIRARIDHLGQIA